MNRVVPLDRLDKEEYAQVICYPRCKPGELGKRLAEIRQLGVKVVCFTGQKNINNIPVLGKGCVGIVVLAHTETGRIALKIRRIDADRAGMKHEAEMLRIANTVGIGPNLLGSSENLLAMEFVDGILLPKWIETLEEKTDTRLRVRKVLRDILEQCWRLDEKGLDHGELSQAPKHIIIDSEDKVFLLDFETASVTRSVSNVTSACHYLFISGKTAELVRATIGGINIKDLLGALIKYKKNRTRKNFKAILRVCFL
jgi:putative serine/threonine protein kinase